MSCSFLCPVFSEADDVEKVTRQGRSFIGRIYNSYMDVFSTLDGQIFVWDSEKASRNLQEHGIRFEQAREVFLDQLAR